MGILGKITKKGTVNTKTITSGISSRANSLESMVVNSRGGKFFDSLVKFEDDKLPSLTWKGRGLMFGIGTLGVGYNMADERYHNDMGTTDGKIYTNTPDYQYLVNQKKKSGGDYPVNSVAGADGSLVFALDRMKNGGFL